MHHAFDVDLAKKYGIVQAVLLEYIAYWVVFNKSLRQNRVDGMFWTYNSLSAMQEQFPYLNERQIKYSLHKLQEDKLVLSRKLSGNKMDKTNWYTLTDKGLEECNIVFDETNLSEATDKTAPIDETTPQKDGSKVYDDETNLSGDKDLLHLTITNNTLHTLPPLTPPPKNAEKIQFAEFVKMKASERQKLVDEFGEEMTQELITILDNYKGAKGVTYKDDYRAIRSWVIKRWQEEHQERQQSKTFAERDRDTFLNTIEEMDGLYGNHK